VDEPEQLTKYLPARPVSCSVALEAVGQLVNRRAGDLDGLLFAGRANFQEIVTWCAVALGAVKPYPRVRRCRALRRRPVSNPKDGPVQSCRRASER
jgi:hypothetical protein